MLIGAAGFVLTVLAPSTAAMSLFTLSIAAFGIWGTLGPYWTLPPALLRGTAAAGGIALVNSIGNMGGFVGPFVVGWVKDFTGGFTSGLLLLAAVLVFGAVVILRVKVPAAA
jgi:ACS family tartrate transporter-like MFS transporter